MPRIRTSSGCAVRVGTSPWRNCFGASSWADIDVDSGRPGSTGYGAKNVARLGGLLMMRLNLLAVLCLGALVAALSTREAIAQGIALPAAGAINQSMGGAA